MECGPSIDTEDLNTSIGDRTRIDQHRTVRQLHRLILIYQVRRVPDIGRGTNAPRRTFIITVQDMSERITPVSFPFDGVIRRNDQASGVRCMLQLKSTRRTQSNPFPIATSQFWMIGWRRPRRTVVVRISDVHFHVVSAERYPDSTRLLILNRSSIADDVCFRVR